MHTWIQEENRFGRCELIAINYHFSHRLQQIVQHLIFFALKASWPKNIHKQPSMFIGYLSGSGVLSK
jgi:hypothetical protein